MPLFGEDSDGERIVKVKGEEARALITTEMVVPIATHGFAFGAKMSRMPQVLHYLICCQHLTTGCVDNFYGLQDTTDWQRDWLTLYLVFWEICC